MKRYSYAAGALLGVLLTALTIVLIIVRTGEMPHVVSVWPLFAALGVSAVTWWLQGLIVAVLARPQLKAFGWVTWSASTWRVGLYGAYPLSRGRRSPLRFIYSSGSASRRERGAPWWLPGFYSTSSS